MICFQIPALRIFRTICLPCDLHPSELLMLMLFRQLETKWKVAINLVSLSWHLWMLFSCSLINRHSPFSHASDKTQNICAFIRARRQPVTKQVGLEGSDNGTPLSTAFTFRDSRGHCDQETSLTDHRILSALLKIFLRLSQSLFLSGFGWTVIKFPVELSATKNNNNFEAESHVLLFSVSPHGSDPRRLLSSSNAFVLFSTRVTTLAQTKQSHESAAHWCWKGVSAAGPCKIQNLWVVPHYIHELKFELNWPYVTGYWIWMAGRRI